MDRVRHPQIYEIELSGAALEVIDKIHTAWTERCYDQGITPAIGDDPMNSVLEAAILWLRHYNGLE